VSALTTLIEAPALFTTQTAPSGAMASVRGALPTVTSASFARVTTSKTLTLSLSGLVTHSRVLPPWRGSSARFDDIAGLRVATGRWTV